MTVHDAYERRPISLESQIIEDPVFSSSVENQEQVIVIKTTESPENANVLLLLPNSIIIKKQVFVIAKTVIIMNLFVNLIV